MNETSSEGSENIPNENLNKKDSIIEVEIIDFLNDVVDEVCTKFDKCTELLSKERQEQDVIDIMRIAQNTSINNVNVNQSLNEAILDVPKEKVSVSIAKLNERVVNEEKLVCLNKKANGKDIKVYYFLSDSEDEDCIQKESEVQKRVSSTSLRSTVSKRGRLANLKSPINKCNTPITRKKRKLYSPKDVDNDTIDEILKPKVDSKQSNVNKTPIAACYKEIEKERKSASRIPRKLRSSTEPLSSPRTKRQNDVFDKLKERVDNEEKIKLVNRKANNKDLAASYYISDSDDEDFKQKKSEVQKRVSSTSLRSTVSKRGRLANRINYSTSLRLNSVEINDFPNDVVYEVCTKFDKCTELLSKERQEQDVIDNNDNKDFKQKESEVQKRVSSKSSRSIVSKRGRLTNRVNYTESNNSSADESKKKPKKRKVVKQSKQRSCKVIVEPCNDLVDERMRETAPVVLNTSFVKERVDKTSIQEPAPAIEKALVMEMIPEDTHDAPLDLIVPEIKATRRKKPNALKLKKDKKNNKKPEKSAEMLAVKEEKGVVKRKSNEQNGGESPLPGLVVDTEKSQLDDITASVKANMQRLKKKYTKVMNDFEKIANISANKDFALVDHNQNIQEPKRVDLDTVVLSDTPSEKSIATDGKSPITAHNDLDESPPNVALLEEKISERDLNIQDMNQTMAEFFIQLRNAQVDKTPKASSEKSRASPVLMLTWLSSKDCAMTFKSNLSTPKVVLSSRISSKELEIYSTSKKSKSSYSTCSPEVKCEVCAMERKSSDDINKWLPMPPINREYSEEEKPKKYDTRLSKQKLGSVVKKTPERQVKNKFRSIISPIKLSFDNDEFKLSSYSTNKDNYNVGALNKTRTRSMMSREMSKSVDKVEPPKTKTQKSLGIETVEFLTKRNVIKPSSSGSVYKSSISEIRQEIDDAPAPVVRKDVRCKIDSDNTPGGSQSAASVNEWFKRNVASKSPSKADTNLAKDIVGKVMETLDTTLDEIQQSTNRKLALMFLDNQRRLSQLHEESRELDKRTVAEIMAVVQDKWAERDRKLKEMVEDFERVQRQRACEVSQADREQTTLMVRLLKEDLQAVLDFTDTQNK